MHAFDNRVDLAVPVVTALAVRRDGGPGTLSFAAGAALDPATAVEAALCEALTYIPHLPRQVAERPAELAAMAAGLRAGPPAAGPRGALRAAGDGRARAVLPGAGRRAAAGRGLPGLAAAAVGRPAGGPGCCSARSPAPGCDAIVVDQTTPEQARLGLRTVCTLVPGLLPIDFGWSRQRALTMPRLRTAWRRAGRRPDDLAEAELHRVPHPFP